MLINYGVLGQSQKQIIEELRNRVRTKRLEQNLTQVALAKKSGVSFGTLKYFERFGKISLKNLVMLAIALNESDGFQLLFTKKHYQTLNDVIAESAVKIRKRGRINY